jgi:hypothetical protein
MCGVTPSSRYCSPDKTRQDCRTRPSRQAAKVNGIDDGSQWTDVAAERTHRGQQSSARADASTLTTRRSDDRVGRAAQGRDGIDGRVPDCRRRFVCHVGRETSAEFLLFSFGQAAALVSEGE